MSLQKVKQSITNVNTSDFDATEAYFATNLNAIDSEQLSMDPAERLEFSRLPKSNIQRFDNRAIQELEEVMFSHEIPMERERASWEYGQRLSSEALPTLLRYIESEKMPELKWSTLWLIQKIAGNKSENILSSFLLDDHPEVADWARLLLREITGKVQIEKLKRPAIIDASNPFDQTLPLTISGFARTLIPSLGWVEVTLSPLWFESIMGRVMACTNRNTFESELIIEKRIKEYHPDNSNHYEIYKFNGFTTQLSDHVAHHNYECYANHTFYPSGKVEDSSEGAVSDVIVNLKRVATTITRNLSDYKITAFNNRSDLTKVPPTKIVESVRGRYMGAAYVNIKRLLENGMVLGPGEVQLSSLNHPTVGNLTNTFIFGTFKGKLSDIDGDGSININTERCHGTLKGELDYDLNGIPTPDPYDIVSNSK